MTELLFDALLAVALVGTALRTLMVPELFRAVVLFITFGLLLTLAWARLDAPDIALAEAAIGAGLTGALVLDAVGHLRRVENARRDRQDQEGPENRGDRS